jgi:subtilisin family serine protease
MPQEEPNAATATLTHPERFFVVFPQPQMAVMAETITPVKNLYRSKSQADTVIAELSDKDYTTLIAEGAKIIPSRQYSPLPDPLINEVFAPFNMPGKSLKDVLKHIKAEEAWQISRGEGVHVAIVDTGVCGTMKEFSGTKKAPANLTWPQAGDDPWTDPVGHGSMTACIATATDKYGGKYNGVAPDSTLIACRSTLSDTDLYQIYDHLITLVDSKTINKLVVNNSYGLYTCQPSGVTRNDPFPSLVLQAIAKDIFVVFAAGNNHVKVCTNDPKLCSPNTIWSTNSLDEVVAVGTVDENNKMDQPCKNPNGYCHRDSSRGPGELHQNSEKPNCVAPTYGEVMWGCGYQSMEWWGTSGAAPQVTGLGALIFAKAPWLTSAQVTNVIEESCTDIGLGKTCAGAGVINCAAALAHDLVTNRPEVEVEPVGTKS